MKLHPAGHRVLIRKKQIEETTKSGIIVVTEDKKDMLQAAEQFGYVEELGPNAFKAFDDGEPWCAVGDLVFLTRYSGEWKKDAESGKYFQIVNDEDILAIVEAEIK